MCELIRQQKHLIQCVTCSKICNKVKIRTIKVDNVPKCVVLFLQRDLQCFHFVEQSSCFGFHKLHVLLQTASRVLRAGF